MNEKIKLFFAGFGAAVIAVGSFLLGMLLHNNGNSDDGIKSDSERLSDTTERLSGTTDKLSETNDRFSELIGEIEKTKHE